MKLQDVYQAPAEAVEPGTQRAVELPRLAVVLLVAAVFLGQVLTGLAMRVGSLHPSGLLPVAWGGPLLTGHGSLVFGFANAVQLLLALMLVGPSAATPAFKRFAAVALWTIAIQSLVLFCLAVLPSAPERLVSVVAAAPSLTAAGALVFAAVHSRKSGLLYIGALALCALGAPLLLAPRGEHSFVLSVLVIYRLCSSKGEGLAPWYVAGLATFCAVLAFRAWMGSGFVALSILQVLVGSCLMIACWKQLAHMQACPGARAFAKSGLVLLVLGILLRLLQQSSGDLTLDDTLVVVAAHHAEVLGLSFLIAAFVVNWVWLPELRHRHVTVLRAAAASSGLAAIAFMLLLALLGGRGMPRRYMRYLEEFQQLHVAASVMVGLFVLSACVYTLVMLRAGAVWLGFHRAPGNGR